MGIVYLDDGRLADQFQMGDEPYVLSDALVMRPEDYEKMTPEEVAAMKQWRYDKWYAIVIAPPVEMPVEEVPADPAV